MNCRNWGVKGSSIPELLKSEKAKTLVGRGRVVSLWQPSRCGTCVARKGRRGHSHPPVPRPVAGCLRNVGERGSEKSSGGVATENLFEKTGC